MNDLVSICTPCYNHEQYLPYYFESIINQDYKEIELILLDDCSSDNSRSIIRKYLPILKTRFVRVQYIENKKNQGVIKSCNTLLRYSKGKYVKFFASDDMMKKQCISELVLCLHNNKEYDMVYGNVIHIDNNSTYDKINILQRIKAPVYKENEILIKLLSNNYIPAPSVMIKREFIKQIGLFDENAIYEDYEYWVRIARKGKIAYLNRFLVYYRKSDNAITDLKFHNKKYLNLCKAELYVINKYKNEIHRNMYSVILKNKFKMLIKQSFVNRTYFVSFYLCIKYCTMKNGWFI